MANFFVDKIIEMVQVGKMTPKDAAIALAKSDTSKDVTASELDHLKTFPKFYAKQAVAIMAQKKYSEKKDTIKTKINKLVKDVQKEYPDLIQAKIKDLIIAIITEEIEVTNG